MYFLVGFLVAMGSAIVYDILKTRDIIRLKREKNELIERIITYARQDDLLRLQKQQIELSEEEKLRLLINCHNITSNKLGIDYLKKIAFKPVLEDIVSHCSPDKKMTILRFILTHFSSATSNTRLFEGQTFLSSFINELLAKKMDWDIIDLVIENWSTRDKTLDTLLTIAGQNELALQYLRTKVSWLKAHYPIDKNGGMNHFWFMMKTINDLPFLHELLNWFPKGSLGNSCLTQIIINVIDKQIDDWSLYKKICIFHEDDSKTRCLNEVLQLAMEKNLFKLMECLLQSNQIMLDEEIIFRVFKTKNEKAAALFSQYNLLDINRLLAPKSSIVERCLALSSNTNDERETQQKILEMLLIYGVDLNIPMVLGKKELKIKEEDTFSLLGYLVYRALDIANNSDLYALRLQKFTALFFDLPGTSMSYKTLCVHSYMIDVFTHWNFILDLYFKKLQDMQKINLFENQIAELYSFDGTYDTALSYQRYQNGTLVVFPVHLRGVMNEAHVATVGFMKIAGSNKHLRVEADRGMGREDFTVFEELTFESERDLQAFTHSVDNNLSLEDEWQAETFRKNKIIKISIGKQRMSSCASMSIKHAILISHFLYQLQQNNNLQEISAQEKERLFRAVFQNSNQWFTHFLIRMQQVLLQAYEALDKKYIDSNFLEKLNKEHSILKHPVSLNDSQNRHETIPLIILPPADNTYKNEQSLERQPLFFKTTVCPNQHSRIDGCQAKLTP